MKQNKTSISDDELDKVAGGNLPPLDPDKMYESMNRPSWYGTSKCPGPEACDVHMCNGCKDRGFSLRSRSFVCGHK